jgi:hypothetical protein
LTHDKHSQLCGISCESSQHPVRLWNQVTLALDQSIEPRKRVSLIGK